MPWCVCVCEKADSLVFVRESSYTETQVDSVKYKAVGNNYVMRIKIRTGVDGKYFGKPLDDFKKI